MKKKILLLSVIGIVFSIGYYLGMKFPIDDSLPAYADCHQIARYHADLLMRKYYIKDGFNTDINNPRRELNQKAAELNAKLLSICNTNPEK